MEIRVFVYINCCTKSVWIVTFFREVSDTDWFLLHPFLTYEWKAWRNLEYITIPSTLKVPHE